MESKMLDPKPRYEKSDVVFILCLVGLLVFVVFVTTIAWVKETNFFEWPICPNCGECLTLQRASKADAGLLLVYCPICEYRGLYHIKVSAPKYLPKSISATYYKTFWWW